MFDTHSEEWERVGLAVDFDEKSLRSGRRRLAVLVPLFIAVIVVYGNYKTWFGTPDSHVETLIQVVAVLSLLGLGWAIARDIGRVAGPTFFRRMDPGTAGTVGFLVRLVTVGITLLVALEIAGVSAASLVATSAFTAVIVGLAAQQTLGNLFAGMVLLSARPFRVGERVRFQAGAVGGQIEGIVSSLGLLYTTLAQGEDRIMVPNNVVLSAVVVPIREPDSVDVKVRLGRGIRVTPGPGDPRRQDQDAYSAKGLGTARATRRRRRHCQGSRHPGSRRRRRTAGRRDHRRAGERHRRTPGGGQRWRRTAGRGADARRSARRTSRAGQRSVSSALNEDAFAPRGLTARRWPAA